MHFRKATENDIPSIVTLLADDELGSTRESIEDCVVNDYVEAFAEMEAQSGNQLILAIDDQSVVGCLQLTLIPGLARRGMKRAQIEGVRVDRRYRSQGVGQALFEHAISIAKDEGAGLVQLTTDKQRADAHRFYERLGFTASHEGMKLLF
ncbi:GNAT family N-acetyltransferase [Sporosarcina aquimarina]|uniref:GNAT family N-acetyltransferase n=1 Tax=Sporosarcina aquimarina TaxID=114975 RepID=UPI002041C426|nr:GNAT family N-acetyltransferase [Sporosarcina aquimarina]MCM3758544.1 GNAT family N-acetyltransferase [Sporosarcina aquimarina]